MYWTEWRTFDGQRTGAAAFVLAVGVDNLLLIGHEASHSATLSKVAIANVDGLMLSTIGHGCREVQPLSTLAAAISLLQSQLATPTFALVLLTLNSQLRPRSPLHGGAWGL